MSKKFTNVLFFIEYLFLFYIKTKYLNISNPKNNKLSLTQLLNKTAPIKLKNQTCDMCGSKTAETIENQLFYKGPKILTLNIDNQNSNKINIDFEMTLNNFKYFLYLFILIGEKKNTYNICYKNNNKWNIIKEDNKLSEISKELLKKYITNSKVLFYKLKDLNNNNNNPVSIINKDEKGTYKQLNENKNPLYSNPEYRLKQNEINNYLNKNQNIQNNMMINNNINNVQNQKVLSNMQNNNNNLKPMPLVSISQLNKMNNNLNNVQNNNINQFNVNNMNKNQINNNNFNNMNQNICFNNNIPNNMIMNNNIMFMNQNMNMMMNNINQNNNNMFQNQCMNNNIMQNNMNNQMINNNNFQMNNINNNMNQNFSQGNQVNKINQDKDMTIFFEFKDKKQLYLDVDEKEIFKDVINRLKEKYENMKTINVKEYKFNEKIIDINKSIKQLGIINRSKISIVKEQVIKKVKKK